MKSVSKTIWRKCYSLSSKLAEISQKLNLSFAITPVNCSLEREQFFHNFKQGKEYNPTFIYPELKVNISTMEKAIESIFAKKELLPFKEIGLFQTLEKLCKYLDKKIELFKAIGTPEFSTHSLALYGKPDRLCIDTARKILEGDRVQYDEIITAKAIKEALGEEIKKFNLDWRIRIVDNITTKVSISSLNKEILINKKSGFTLFEARRLKVHEVDIHVIRAENGSRQPLSIFQTGLGGYQETEEGLSVYFEEKTNNLDKFQERLYAARALGVALALKGSFFFVFSRLSQYLPEGSAYRITERIKRGIRETSREGGISKDYHYISGREKIKEYIKRQGDIRLLFVGKIGLEDVHLVKKLLEKAILNKPVIFPDFINN